MCFMKQSCLETPDTVVINRVIPSQETEICVTDCTTKQIKLTPACRQAMINYSRSRNRRHLTLTGNIFLTNKDLPLKSLSFMKYERVAQD